jgi:hypothetical protein
VAEQGIKSGDQGRKIGDQGIKSREARKTVSAGLSAEETQ